MDYRDAIEYIVSRRRDELARADAAMKSLILSDPEFAAAELDLRAAELDFARGKIDAATAEKKRKVRDGVVKRKGYAAILYPAPHCEKCSDQGRTPDGELCECVKRLAIGSADENVALPLRSFDEFDPSLYPENVRDFVTRIVSELRTIALKGRNSVRKNINLIGKTGTGKTFLMSCFANETMLRGGTAVVVTAFGLVDRALRYHTGDDRGAIADLLECDVLAIDDLGTETMLRNVTKEYLYHIINERQLRGSVTIVTSNLTLDELAARYGERVASRLLDKRLSYTREFSFPDIRRVSI